MAEYLQDADERVMEEIPGRLPVLSSCAKYGKNARAQEIDQFGFGPPVASEYPRHHAYGLFSSGFQHWEKTQVSISLTKLLGRIVLTKEPFEFGSGKSCGL